VIDTKERAHLPAFDFLVTEKFLPPDTAKRACAARISIKFVSFYVAPMAWIFALSRYGIAMVAPIFVSLRKRETDLSTHQLQYCHRNCRHVSRRRF
jgi:hypothetical protein